MKAQLCDNCEARVERGSGLQVVELPEFYYASGTFEHDFCSKSCAVEWLSR